MAHFSNRFWVAMTICAGILVAAIIGISVHGGSADETKELRLLHVVVRHGIRTPQTTYPNDPYVNETFFPYGWGQLTNEGKLELFNTGKYLRGRYGKFLGAIYEPDVYYAQATDVDRTKTSVQMINAGLWPPDALQQWGPLRWQPIPVHMEPLATDSLLLVRKPCPQYYVELERVMRLEEIQRMLDDNKGLFEELTRITGQETNSLDGVQDIFSTLTAEEAYNLTLPAWTKDYYPDRMLLPTIHSYVLNAFTPKLKRLKGGVLLKKLISDWKAVAEGTIKPAARRAFLYAGHDSTIANILSALSVWDPQIPVYGITILFELHRDKITNRYGVEIYLRNSTEVLPHLLTIPGCESFCPLHKLIELTNDVTPGNWDEECASLGEDYSVPPIIGP